MNKLVLLVAATGVLAGCQSFEPTQQGVRSVYSGDNSVLYQVRKQAGSANQAMLMADAAYRAGDLDQALYLYLRTLELEPKHYAALVAIGRIHRERGNLQLAEMALNEVLAATPDDIEALAELGLLRLEQRDLGQARTALERALTLDQQRLGKALGAGALQPGELSVDRASPVRLYNAMGVLADLGSSFAEAEGYYRLALQIDPRSPLVNNSQAYSYYLAGQWDAAERLYRRAIDLSPGYSPLLRNFGLLLARSGRYEEAIAVFERGGSRAQASNDVGYICLVEGRLDQAEQFFRSALELSPSHYATAAENLERVRQLRLLREMELQRDGLAASTVH
ncbi:tetratricopeptide repeat protein [Stutzerimonas balearica]|uniref:Tetratricopeptide repeat-containing protein n=1 Tax=Stutzerimonas balearica DSM 6083 TaxID=1123016 RepID=A0A8D3Y292_9GAMM|nr:tetratricopeptide repeat protein [Stutzerimonas balearica]AJE15687.1 hypothetical protein CL52_11840 [Stutzerimonas balearica DSM 6083]SDM50624.1 Tetratricopeptide repeat-containing protein [Stutzerimonas balearica DSM 6083]